MTTARASPVTLEPAPERADAACELRAVSKVYYKPDGSVMVEALKGVDLVIRRGEYVAIMGPSGSGKSTLLTLLGCLDRPTGGQFLVGGRDVRAMSDEELSVFRGRTIGFVFQSFNLIAQHSILENVGVPLFYQNVPPADRHRRAAEMLDLVGLGDRVHHRPMELSGGQQQRAAIARALVTNPLILLADEPTGNLDSATGQSILALFDRLHEQGMTVIMVTHDPAIGDRARRVVRLRDGLVEVDRMNPPRAATVA
ncbi:MAG: ABC transporter ATP-binding protein [Phycisphaeraceae bacterium]|nr:MAG: ABC transporter ATP-binding protein [Phycisphaeraceae bacterium]